MKILIEEVRGDDGFHGLVAKWDSPEGRINYAWDTDLLPSDYEEEPLLMESLRDDILQTYRRMSR